MVPARQLGNIIMPLLTGDQHDEVVMMIADDYGSRLIGGEVSEITGLILENLPGFETVDSNTLTQVINDIGNFYDFRYEVKALALPGLRNGVIFSRKTPPKDSTLDW